MQFALKELTKVFEEKHNIETELIIASSGKHTAQIIEGAPFDLFLSADLSYPETVYKSGLSSLPPKIYARGQLVLWSGQKEKELDINFLLSDDVDHIAVANPNNAPYGKATQECLVNLELYSKVKEKLVYGENISQVNQFVSTGAAQLGFTAKSVVLAPAIRFKGSWIDVATQSYSPVNQGIVLLDKRKSYNVEALNFYNFLFSDQAQQILKDFGYLGIER